MQIHRVDLAGALDLLADYLGVHPWLLPGLANADPFPRLGWDGGQGDAPIGSIWAVEGAVLYTLVRLLRPAVLYELGTSAGTSAAHIAAALDANGGGACFTSVDNHSILSPGFECGELIPDGLRDRVGLVKARGVEFIQERQRADFIFDDMTHGAEQVAAVWMKAIDILTPGGVIVSHDAAHPLYTDSVLAGVTQALEAAGQSDPLVLLVKPSDTGLVLWQKPEAA